MSEHPKWKPKNAAELARVKMDENKFRVEFGWDDIDLVGMLETGLIEIVGVNETGENIYKTKGEWKA